LKKVGSMLGRGVVNSNPCSPSALNSLRL